MVKGNYRMQSAKIYDDGLLRIFGAPKGPRVYLGDLRVHHWMGGAVLIGAGLIGLLIDSNKKHRQWYGFCAIAGSVLVLDDLPDFLAFLQDMFGN